MGPIGLHSEKIYLMSDLSDPRVLFAAERTLLAWNRTSIALIAFGFLMERSGVLIRVISAEENSIPVLVTVWVGLLFILMGSVVAVYSSRQYSNVLKTLNPMEFPTGYGARWGIVLNLSIAVLGFVLAFSLLLAH